MKLREFVEQADARVAQLFKHQGRVLPMIHFIDSAGEEGFLPFPAGGSKDEAAAIVRHLFVSLGVTRYVFFDEAWMAGDGVTKEEMEFARQHGVRNLPNRKEVIVLSAEDEAEGCIMGQREIIRPEKGKAKLGPLVVRPFDHAEGRFVGFLPRKGTVQ